MSKNKFKVCQEKPESIRHRNRGAEGSKARKAFVYLAVCEHGVPSRLVADYFGVGITAVSMMARAGQKIAQETGLQDLAGNMKDSIQDETDT